VDLIGYCHLGYPRLLALIARLRPTGATDPAHGLDGLPSASVIIAAYAEQDAIAPRIANLRAPDYQPDRLEVIVACDGSPEATARLACGADVVLELPRGGKIRAQDAGVAGATGSVVAFSDANGSWEPDPWRSSKRQQRPFSRSWLGIASRPGGCS